MAFSTAISGLNAASASLGVIGNNIANAGTTGFKSSRAQFADVYPATLPGSPTPVGAGVRLAAVAQQFSQGGISFTNNSLDLAINGSGFFRLSDNGAVVYSRDGSFGVDKDGYIANSAGLRLTGYLAEDGTIGGTVGELQLDKSDYGPSATTEATLTANLDATATAKGAGDPDLEMGDEVLDPNGDSFVPPRYEPPDPKSYNHATSFALYDSLGNAHSATLYFRKTADNEWTTELSIDNGAFVAADPGTSLTFDDTGTLTDPAGPPLGEITYSAVAVGGGAADLDFTVDFSGSTQFGSSFSVNDLTQNGYTSGRLSGIDVDESGVVMARYTNGQSQALGQVVLSNFNNPQGLAPLGDNAWAESASSGIPLTGGPGTASLGLIQSGALEESNVNLTEQLVDMIIAQRNFQANAQMITTEDAIAQTVINIR
jgi:flagellar hook protein FlgE